MVHIVTEYNLICHPNTICMPKGISLCVMYGLLTVFWRTFSCSCCITRGKVVFILLLLRQKSSVMKCCLLFIFTNLSSITLQCYSNTGLKFMHYKAHLIFSRLIFNICPSLRSCNIHTAYLPIFYGHQNNTHNQRTEACRATRIQDRVNLMTACPSQWRHQT